MKKTILILILIMVMTAFSSCYLFDKYKLPPEKITPDILVSGDVTLAKSIHIEDLNMQSFGEHQGYAISSFLDKAALLADEYDIMILSRDGKAMRIQGITASDCYLIEKEGGVLELHSNVHHYFENSFFPLSGVSELSVLAYTEVDKGIALYGGSEDKIRVESQLDLIYKQLRTYESNGEYIIKEYLREVTSAEKLIGTAQRAVVKLLDNSIVNIYVDTSEILDWKRGHLVLRSSNLPILSITLISA